MTLREYAKLSLRAGFLVGMIDAALGGTEARDFLAPHKRDLTEDLLAELIKRSLARGLKAQVLKRIETYADGLCSNSELIDQGMAAQALRDSTRGK